MSDLMLSSHGYKKFLELCRFMTIKDVARRLNVGWDMIKAIQKRHQDKHFRHPKLKCLIRLTIDEISIIAGHPYQIIVLELGSGALERSYEIRGFSVLV